MSTLALVKAPRVPHTSISDWPRLEPDNHMFLLWEVFVQIADSRSAARWPSMSRSIANLRILCQLATACIRCSPLPLSGRPLRRLTARDRQIHTCRSLPNFAFLRLFDRPSFTAATGVIANNDLSGRVPTSFNHTRQRAHIVAIRSFSTSQQLGNCALRL